MQSFLLHQTEYNFFPQTFPHLLPERYSRPKSVQINRAMFWMHPSFYSLWSGLLSRFWTSKLHERQDFNIKMICFPVSSVNQCNLKTKGPFRLRTITITFTIFTTDITALCYSECAFPLFSVHIIAVGWFWLAVDVFNIYQLKKQNNSESDSNVSFFCAVIV